MITLHTQLVYEEGIGMSLIEEKYEELTKYLMSKCFSWRADYSRYDDIVQNTVARLLEEDKKKPFENARQLWGRATNVVKEEIAQTFADRLPVSGVKFQAHWTATKALQAAGGDPRAAYAMQTGTSRVGRELIYAVSHGPSLYSPEYLADLDPEKREDTSSLSMQDEDNIRVAMFDLTEQERHVVHLRMWMRMTNAQVGEEMGLSAERVRKIWQKALKTMKPLLEKSLGGRYA
jgi:RNA polymerase sigma factor (sigma-70 family)